MRTSGVLTISKIVIQATKDDLNLKHDEIEGGKTMLIRNIGKRYVIKVDKDKYLDGEHWDQGILYFYATTNIAHAFHFETEEDAKQFLKTYGCGGYTPKIVRC